MKKYILNIGLETSLKFDDGAHTLTPEQVLQVLEDKFLKVHYHTLADSFSEETLIATVSDKLGIGFLEHAGIENEILELSRELMQDCIAVYDITEGRGQLVGDYAAEWGEFDPQYFLIN